MGHLLQNQDKIPSHVRLLSTNLHTTRSGFSEVFIIFNFDTCSKTPDPQELFLIDTRTIQKHISSPQEQITHARERTRGDSLLSILDL